MRLVILCVGSPRDAALRSAIQDYESRAARYFRLEQIEVAAAAGHGGDAKRARREEATALRRRMPAGLESWALTRGGSEIASRDLATTLGDMATYGKPGVVFLIGGAFGLDPQLLSECRRQISLSRLTLPHELARLFLAEQLYRAGTILRGEPYHKGS